MRKESREKEENSLNVRNREKKKEETKREGGKLRKHIWKEKKKVTYFKRSPFSSSKQAKGKRLFYNDGILAF